MKKVVTMAKKTATGSLPAMASPMDLWQAGVQLTMLGIETQMVIAYRLLGMSGVWAVAPSENERMVSEKAPAFAHAANAAMRAAASGKRPDEVLTAAVKPLRSRTKSNVRRLSRRGPKNPLG